MSGNVAEWIWDYHADYPTTEADYTGPLSGEYKIIREVPGKEIQDMYGIMYRGKILPSSKSDNGVSCGS